MNEKIYYSHLYKIAKDLNKEFSLQSALRNSLEKTCESLAIETGWIWLTEPNNTSVYLAASYNLPPALKNHPERLSGWCYCIQQYLSDDIEEAINISEIACTRLKDIVSGTNDLKFHATIPIILKGEKVGLLNLLTKASKKLKDEELTILNSISDLIGTTIQRTRFKGNFPNTNQATEKSNLQLTNTFLSNRIEALKTVLTSNLSDKQKLIEIQEKIENFQKDFSILVKETEDLKSKKVSSSGFQFPETPISKRELEVLNLIKEGFTNDEIGKRLCITERTVKFHITAILSKLKANNRTKAVDIALKRGLLSI
ncbi:LuxR C-terminal-related transcriptional regulator [Polaribacter porphyrae]|uniref:HTH luxR-type domain-containing protein n=1 Tax=Polaribacter porphyrae TaxID=1137780 RepID=A0A2S7WJB7_9FLAO|nr:LuxR C-terminal-related transcriptional regulator [Polaribacter porphyrae]PQJ77683.1 hypothetical protein BTO18_00125 [Polaribacter porphyrae]